VDRSKKAPRESRRFFYCVLVAIRFAARHCRLLEFQIESAATAARQGS